MAHTSKIKFEMKKILICGDSFAVNHVEFDKNSCGWSNLLANDNYDVINLAQAGVGEYKIFKQLTSVDLEKFDAVIVCHTSPNRVYIQQHPVHKHSKSGYEDNKGKLKTNNQNIDKKYHGNIAFLQSLHVLI